MGAELFGETNKLYEFRKEKGLTLRTLADMVGISPTMLCRIEKGERIPEPECVSEICDALGLKKNERAELFISFGYMEISDP